MKSRKVLSGLLALKIPVTIKSYLSNKNKKLYLLPQTNKKTINFYQYSILAKQI
jgi:hypothetical protein